MKTLEITGSIVAGAVIVCAMAQCTYLKHHGNRHDRALEIIDRQLHNSDDAVSHRRAVEMHNLRHEQALEMQERAFEIWKEQHKSHIHE